MNEIRDEEMMVLRALARIGTEISRIGYAGGRIAIIATAPRTVEITIAPRVMLASMATVGIGIGWFALASVALANVVIP